MADEWLEITRWLEGRAQGAEEPWEAVKVAPGVVQKGD